MKTLLITSIYAKLHGTTFGGRSCRELHYKWSLLNILNLKPTKVVCFTSEEEYDDLCDWFYKLQGISSKLLELRIFDLKDTRHFDLIQKRKDLEEVVKIQRCREVQYNKFFWSTLITDRHQYDRMYWIDAGLSHGQLFPEKFQVSDHAWNTDTCIGVSPKFEKHFLINLFQPNILQFWSNLTVRNILLIGKNNTGRYSWSTTLPQQYYTESYDPSTHIVGGMFGGSPALFDELVLKFDELLVNLLNNEDKLYNEELLMSCLYVNEPTKYNLLQFDDWNAREEFIADGLKPKLFHHMFLV